MFYFWFVMGLDRRMGWVHKSGLIQWTSELTSKEFTKSS